MGILTFDDESHAYALDGRPVPSVTTILSRAGLINYEFIPKDKREFYLTRGSYVHYATELLDDGDLDWDSLDPDIEPHVRAYAQFKKDTGFQPEMIEFKSYNDSMWYAGTLDRVGMLNGKRVIVDFKSGAVGKWTAIQVCGGYANMKGVGAVSAGYGLELNSEGKYKLSEPWTDFVGAQRVFVAALTIHRWKEMG